MFKKVLSNKNALCNDGTRAVYFLGVQKTSKWVIFLESGTYCLTKAQCLARFGNEYTTVLMSSKHMPDAIKGRDLLSTSRKENQLFYDYSHVLIPYCSSDAFLGTQTRASSPDNNSFVEDFVFSGKIIFQSVILELLRQDLSQAREIVLVGSSAGAVGAYNQVQWLQDVLASKDLDVKLSAIIDGGWFINFQESITSKLVKEFYNVGKPLSRACADSTYGYPCCLSASCMLTRGYYPSNVPTFFVFSMYDVFIVGDLVERFSKRVVMAENGATDLITLVDMYGGAMNQSLFAIEPSFSNLSYFVPACFQHTLFCMSSLRDQGGVLHYRKVFTQGNALFGMTKRPGTWLSTAITRGNETITLQSTLIKWLKTRDQPVRVTDSCLGAMCNPTCPELLKFVDTAADWGWVLNGVVLFVSLVFTVVCVVAKICFMIQLVFMERSQSRYFEEDVKYPQVSTYEPNEPITLLYSSPEVSKHSRSCDKLPETAQENIKDHPSSNNGRLSDDFTAKGYNAIFYRTVQYLRLVFGQRRRNNDEIENIDSHADQLKHQQRKEKFSIANPENGNDEDVEIKRNEFCLRWIHSATLSFKQGELISVVGKPGAGKTTLLKILSGRLMCGCNQEHLFVNGVGQHEIQNSYASRTSFLSKFTALYYGDVTVRQYLLLAALMRMPSSMNNLARVERVEQIILEMNLATVAERKFGGSFKMNLTELQKRLLCLALQLITRPLAVFLDEPITGLDSVSSMELLQILRRLCNNGHLVIITTQAMPGKSTELFNQLVLLSDKQVIYSGEPAKLTDYYSRLSEDKNEKQKELEDYRASLSTSLGHVVYLPIMFSLIGLTAGIVYWQAETPLQIITSYCGSSIPSILFLGAILLSRINRSLEICRLESSLNVGYSYEHVTQVFLSTSAACVLPVIACSALTYFMVMTSYNWWRYFLVTVISLVLNQTWIAVYMMVTYATPSNACHAGLVIAILGGFSGGFIVTRYQMPIGYNLLFYINPQFYGYSAITKVLLQNIRMKCEFESVLNCINTDGNAVLARFFFDSVNPYGHLVVMLCITVLSLLFSWLLCDARSSR
ncbi:hypothetical protein ACROYT_G036145 [Oculina patagonica]